MNETITTERADRRRSIPEITTSLIELLQSHNGVAFVIGLKQGRTVKGWAEGKTNPTDSIMPRRLEVAENLARVVRDEERPCVSRAWLISCNPYLAEDAPMDYIQTLNGTVEDEQTIARLQVAANQFAAG